MRRIAMKALAWDDKPAYLQLLQKSLEDFGIALEIVTTEDEFVKRFGSAEAWDFIITDLMVADYPAQGDGEEVRGVEIARRVADSAKGRDLPIFVVTQYPDAVNASEINLPPSVVVKSKSTRPGWLAYEIRQELERRGLFVDLKKVFLIYGKDKDAPGTRQRLETFLRGKAIRVVTLGDGPLRAEIAQSLLNKMNECGALLAICTPDDETAEHCQPRANVLLEIGLALGLSRGFQRLVLLQRWGPAKKQQAVLPSDLRGILTIQFEGEIDLEFERLTKHLQDLGMEV
jgi:CheY-like chemotaxis protein